MAKKQPPYKVVMEGFQDCVLKDSAALQILIQSAIRELQADS
jgi:hypothetical protein